MEYNICTDKLPTATTAHLLWTKWFANCTCLSQGKSECEHGYIAKNEVGYWFILNCHLNHTKIELGMILVAIWYDYHTSVFAAVYH